jgi:hypothetical protein
MMSKIIWIVGLVSVAANLLLAWSVKPKADDHIVSMGFGIPTISPPTEEEIVSLPGRLLVYRTYVCLAVGSMTVGVTAGIAFSSDICLLVTTILALACTWRAIFLAAADRSGW